MELIIYIITRVILVACSVVIIYIIALPEEKISDYSDIW